MQRNVFHQTVKTCWGAFLISYSCKGLVSLKFPRHKIAHSRIGREIPKSLYSLAPKLVRLLEQYVKGAPFPERSIAVDWNGLTEIQQKTFKILQTIPFGETRSYEWLAKRAGIPKGARAIGQIVGSNPAPVFVPCHRILRKDGGLGGFSSGLKWKRKLLAHERRFV